MSPIRKETIRTVDLPSKQRYGFKRVVRAEGDEEHPGTWEHVITYLRRGAKISAGTRTRNSGIEHIVDVPIREGRPISERHRDSKELRGVWKKIGD